MLGLAGRGIDLVDLAGSTAARPPVRCADRRARSVRCPDRSHFASAAIHIGGNERAAFPLPSVSTVRENHADVTNTPALNRTSGIAYFDFSVGKARKILSQPSSVTTCRHPASSPSTPRPIPRDAARSAGLRYTTDAASGHPPQAQRQAVSLRRRRKASWCALATSWQRIRVAGHPAGLDRCLDLPRSARASAGDRPRRAGAQAISLSPQVARGPRRDQVPPSDRLRASAAGDPPAHGGRSARLRSCRARKCWRRSCGCSRRRYPRRQRRVRTAEPVVRTDDAARRTCRR